tara:strand:- start:5209 stop:5454 length:246 start_codon:yes stop_codon:yes gene_type:complete
MKTETLNLDEEFLIEKAIKELLKTTEADVQYWAKVQEKNEDENHQVYREELLINQERAIKLKRLVNRFTKYRNIHIEKIED